MLSKDSLCFHAPISFLSRFYSFMLSYVTSILTLQAINVIFFRFYAWSFCKSSLLRQNFYKLPFKRWYWVNRSLNPNLIWIKNIKFNIFKLPIHEMSINSYKTNINLDYGQPHNQNVLYNDMLITLVELDTCWLWFFNQSLPYRETRVFILSCTVVKETKWLLTTCRWFGIHL